MEKVKGQGFIDAYDWGLYPKAENFLKKQLNIFLRNHSFARQLSNKIGKQTSTKLFDWIDYIQLPNKKIDDELLKKLEFTEDKKVDVPYGTRVFKHSKTFFFPILLYEGDDTEIALKPEDLEHFHKKFGRENKIQGKKYSRYRKLEVKKENNYILSAVERRGYPGFIIDKIPLDINGYKNALNSFMYRKRNFNNDGNGMLEIMRLIESLNKKLDKSRVADAFFRAERIYWEKRNKAGKVQKRLQDEFGLGWGNHDHHTYRSSRKNFKNLINIFENLGFICRERFYAGERAGWGAQILENTNCGIVIFADVDLTIDEKDTDFAHKGLRNLKRLGTVGLWIGLHGESILQSGMHHLEARFIFNKLRKNLPKYNISFMNPFSNFKFLKQAFSVGEQWRVDKRRLENLLKKGSINQEHYTKFLKEGAIGSHLENLQRTQGYKGFNQNSVTAIIKATDPRKYVPYHRGA